MEVQPPGTLNPDVLIDGFEPPAVSGLPCVPCSHASDCKHAPRQRVRRLCPGTSVLACSCKSKSKVASRATGHKCSLSGKCRVHKGPCFPTRRTARRTSPGTSSAALCAWTFHTSQTAMAWVR